MFAPMRPSPMKPSCIAVRLRSMLTSGQRAPDRALEDRQVVREVVAQVDLHDGSIMRPQRLAVTTRLGVDQAAEGVRPTRDLAIDRVIGGELQEYASCRAALVQLTRGVEEARPVAGGGGAAGRGEGGADGGDALVDRRGRGDERLDGQVARHLEG